MELPVKERAIQALSACGFQEIGRDGSGLRLFESPSGGLLIGVGSCRSLAYSPTGPGGRLQLVAASRTPALLCRITALDRNPANYFPIHSGDAPAAMPRDGDAIDNANRRARVFKFAPMREAVLEVEGDAAEPAQSAPAWRDEAPLRRFG